MTIDDIYQRYMQAMSVVTADGGWVEWPVVRLGLRLAVEDAFAVGGALCDDLAAIVASQAQPQPQPDQRQAEADRAQIAKVAEWLAEHRPALYYGDHGGFGDAMIQAIEDSQAQQAELAQQLIQLDADNADLRRKLIEAQRVQPPIHTNGARPVDPTTAPDWNSRSHPAWRGLTDEEREQLYAVVSGDQTWRSLSKKVRLRLVQRVMVHLTEATPLTQVQFDALRPSWMPTASTLSSTVATTWSELQASAIVM